MTNFIPVNHDNDFPATCRMQFDAYGLTFSVFDDLASLEKYWRRLQLENNTTYFQTYDWCASWLATVGASEHIEPYVVVAQNTHSQFIALLPFQIRKLKFGTRLEWLTTPQLIYGYGIFSDLAFRALGQQALDSVLPLIVRHSKVSSIHLGLMPEILFGEKHPFVSHFNARDADCTSLLDLLPSYDTLLSAKRSSDSRKNIRWRDSKIAAAGQLKIDEVRDINALDELLSDQAARLAEAGISDPAQGGIAAFFRQLIRSPSQNLSVVRVAVDGNGIASVLLAKHDGVAIDLMTSLAASDLRRYSPGDLVLRKSIELACDQGLKLFDFSLGAATYKSQWADRTVRLHHSIKASTISGVFDALPRLVKNFVRTLIKTNPVIKHAVYKVRRVLRSS